MLLVPEITWQMRRTSSQYRTPHRKRIRRKVRGYPRARGGQRMSKPDPACQWSRDQITRSETQKLSETQRDTETQRRRETQRQRDTDTETETQTRRGHVGGHVPGVFEARVCGDQQHRRVDACPIQSHFASTPVHFAQSAIDCACCRIQMHYASIPYTLCAL
eukprot:3941250-Rhodomonas_salina.2